MTPSTLGTIHPLALRDTVSDQAAQWLKNVLSASANIFSDSRRLRPGDGFLARDGRSANLLKNIELAISRGAAAVLVDQDQLASLPAHIAKQAALHGLPCLADRMGMVAAAFYGRPSMSLQLLAVTGTNGKSSVTTALAFALARNGVHSAVIGTLGCAVFPAHCAIDFTPNWSEEETAGLTTPDAVDLQRLLAALRDRSVSAVALEASSIGLVQGRLQGCAIKTAVFTNLSHDHLDLHGNMEQYAKAKALLFEASTLGAAVINMDDPYGSTMWHSISAHAKRISVGQRSLPNADAQLKAALITLNEHGLVLDIEGTGKAAPLSGAVSLPVYGRHNAENALMVAGCLLTMGLKAEEIHARLSEFHLPPGRIQMIQAEGSPWACIDYAHSPSALLSVLESLRAVTDRRAGRLVCVFGCGGDRDRAKRPLMGEIAARIADRVVLTSDNPRTEPADEIIADIRRGVPSAIEDKVVVIEDRAVAIAQAIQTANAHDLVLIAGKGHEQSQLIGGQALPFSDLQEVRQAIRQWGQDHAIAADQGRLHAQIG